MHLNHWMKVNTQLSWTMFSLRSFYGRLYGENQKPNSHHPTAKEQKSDTIYSIPCNDCNQGHIGQTKRQLWTRLKEHQKAFSISKKDNSAFSEHTCQTNHTIAWDNSKIITTNRRYYQRRCMQAWHINSAHDPLNRDDGGLLPNDYLLLINRCCHHPKSSIKGNTLQR